MVDPSSVISSRKVSGLGDASETDVQPRRKKPKKHTVLDPYVAAEQATSSLDVGSATPEEPLPPAKKSKKRRLAEMDEVVDTSEVSRTPRGADAADRDGQTKKKRRKDTSVTESQESVLPFQSPSAHEEADTGARAKRRKAKKRHVLLETVESPQLGSTASPPTVAEFPVISASQPASVKPSKKHREPAVPQEPSGSAATRDAPNATAGIVDETATGKEGKKKKRRGKSVAVESADVQEAPSVEPGDEHGKRRKKRRKSKCRALTEEVELAGPVEDIALPHMGGMVPAPPERPPSDVSEATTDKESKRSRRSKKKKARLADALDPQSQPAVASSSPASQTPVTASPSTEAKNASTPLGDTPASQTVPPISVVASADPVPTSALKGGTCYNCLVFAHAYSLGCRF